MPETTRIQRLPSWLKAKAPGSPNYLELKGLVSELRLHTVCESARCPNIGECWHHRTATFMILGDVCTRSCGFCAIKTGRPGRVDEEEPERVADAVSRLNLQHAVITSVNRDELPDGGARIFARTIEALHRRCPGTTVEVLIPDFKGDEDALRTVLQAGPEILNHNVETVPRLYPVMRPQARYERSLELLARAHARGPAPTKSGIMLGAGETHDEISRTIRDLAGVRCSILTVGQYLSPSPQHVPVDRFVPPEEFTEWAGFARGLGFAHVESGPLVRSSYRAAGQVGELRRVTGPEPAAPLHGIAATSLQKEQTVER
ncbi:MAG: lipoyl synthase [Candidatus Latescibacterota bacterium]|jgi:lipoic acid synthetase